jgi:hypothetical protein
VVVTLKPQRRYPYPTDQLLEIEHEVDIAAATDALIERVKAGELLTEDLDDNSWRNRDDGRLSWNRSVRASHKAKDPRLAALAQTHFEDAAMWAVKLVTTP